MKPECAAAVRAAVGNRQLSDKEMRGIEERLRGAMQTLRRQDPDGWAGMSPSDRLQEAAKLARANQLKDMAAAHANAISRLEKKARNDGAIFSLKPGDQVKGMIADHFATHGAKQASLESEIQAWQRFYAGRIDGKTDRLLDDRSKNRAILQELFGQDSGDAEAKRGAKAVTDVMERMRQHRERAGIPVNKLENYHLPQAWDSFRIGPQEEFVKDAMQHVDKSEFIDASGNQMPDDKIADMLKESWLTLATGGANKRALGTARGTSKVGSRANAPRLLHFKNADSWLYMMGKYGTHDRVGGVLREHIHRVGRDIAIAERHGQMADADVMQRLEQAYTNDRAEAKGSLQKISLKHRYDQFRRLWDVQLRGHQIGNSHAASALATVRAVLGAAKLGTLVSQIPSDTAMILTHLKAMGFDRPATAGAFGKALSSSDRKAFLRAAGMWLDNFHANTSRLGDTEVFNRTTNFLHSGVYKLSGMRAADRANTGLIADSIMNTFGRRTRKYASIEDLPEADKQWTQRYGIDQEHWDVMRFAEPDKTYDDGRMPISPQSVYAIPDEYLAPLAARRLQGRSDITESDMRDEIGRLKDDTVKAMLRTFQEAYHAAGRGFAGSSLREQDRLGLIRNQAGTFSGELFRALWSIRQVPLGLTMTHYFDVPAGLSGWKPKASYIARYALGQMAATAFMVQAKHLISGEDPEDMTKALFVKKLAAGAVLGPLLATILFGSQGEHTDAGVPLGPAGDALTQALQLGMRGRDELEGKPPGAKDRFSADKYSAQWLSFVRSNAVPFANMWYTKAAFNHLIYQQLQEQISPGYNDRVRKRMRKENLHTWWSPGETTPHRAPDFGAAIGQPSANP